MLTLEQLVLFFPEHLRQFKRNIMREYLQYKILEIIFDTAEGRKLSFLGGTALRIVHGNARFSEDLDFDNTDLTEEDFQKLSKTIQKKFGEEGVETEIRTVAKNAFRCYLKIPRILFHEQLAATPEEKMLIQIDTLTHNYTYEAESVIINKFDVFTEIRTTPLPVILSQKIVTAFDRKRPKGRDFYDIVFLRSRAVRPDLQYLSRFLDIDSPEKLQSYLIAQSEKLDFGTLANDVEPFLFNPEDKKKVLLFPAFIRQEQWQ